MSPNVSTEQLVALKARAEDGPLPPEALARLEAERHEAKLRRLRLYVGIAGAALCGLAFLVALYRDNNLVLIGSFLGIMVAGNVIPFSEVKSLIPTRGGS